MLPIEIVNEIFEYLSNEDCRNLCCVNSMFKIDDKHLSIRKVLYQSNIFDLIRKNDKNNLKKYLRYGPRYKSDLNKRKRLLEYLTSIFPDPNNLNTVLDGLASAFNGKAIGKCYLIQCKSGNSGTTTFVNFITDVLQSLTYRIPSDIIYDTSHTIYEDIRILFVDDTVTEHYRGIISDPLLSDIKKLANGENVFLRKYFTNGKIIVPKMILFLLSYKSSDDDIFIKIPTIKLTHPDKKISKSIVNLKDDMLLMLIQRYCEM